MTKLNDPLLRDLLLKLNWQKVIVRKGGVSG